MADYTTGNVNETLGSQDQGAGTTDQSLSGDDRYHLPNDKENTEMINAKARTIVVDAIPFTQSGHRLYMVKLTGQELIDCSVIDHFDSSKAPDDPEQGYQRPPERSRITRIGTFLVNGVGNGLYPNALLLGARTPLVFDEMTRRLQLPSDLRIIDGQHRTEGLRYAIEEKGHLPAANLQVPVVIMEVSDRDEELDQFRIINGTAKSVRTDLVNSIITALAEHQGEDSVASKDRWKIIVTKVVDIMDRTPGSPWEDMLLMPDQVGKDFPDKIARATSVMTSIRPIYTWLEEFGIFRDRAGTSFDEQSTYMAGILIEYWRALKAVVPEAFSAPDDYVIQKTPGLFALHMILRDRLLPRIYHGRRDWDQETFEEFLGVSPEITDYAFWDRTENRAAAYGSMKGFRDLADLLNDSLDPD